MKQQQNQMTIDENACEPIGNHCKRKERKKGNSLNNYATKMKTIGKYENSRNYYEHQWKNKQHQWHSLKKQATLWNSIKNNNPFNEKQRRSNKKKVKTMEVNKKQSIT